MAPAGELGAGAAGAGAGGVGAIGSGQVATGSVPATTRTGADDGEVARAPAKVLGAAVDPDEVCTSVCAWLVTDETAVLWRPVAVPASSLTGGATNSWIAAVVSLTIGRITSVIDLTGGTGAVGSDAESTTAATALRADGISCLTAVVTGLAGPVIGFATAATAVTAAAGATAEDGTADGLTGLPRGATGSTDGAIGRSGALGITTGAEIGPEIGPEMGGVAACACPLVSSTPAATAPNSNPA